MFVPTINFLKAYLNSLFALPADPLGEAFVGLYAEGSVLSQGMADDTLIVEPGYTGYARQAIAFPGISYIAQDGLPTIAGEQHEFRPTDGVGAGALCLGMFISIGDGDPGSVVNGWEAFPSPKNMQNADDRIVVEPSLSLDPSGNFGSVVFDL